MSVPGSDCPTGKWQFATFDADGRSEQCVFCQLIGLAHHIETYVVPTIPDETTRDQARLLVGAVRSNANDLSRLIRH
jgi:hypothetical protein